MLLDDDPVQSIAAYRRRGGLDGLAATEALGPAGVIAELIASGLRGRGGAGFPTGVKWQSIIEGGPDIGDRYVVANGAEGEPGTFKDRALLRHDPYAVIEGVLIAAKTLGAARAYIALKSSFEAETARLASAVAEFDELGLADGVRIELVLGPDEYLFGEEKALLEVIEGEDPLPRQFPPYVYGLFSSSPQLGWSAGRTLGDPSRSGANPTLVNNVETYATVAKILAKGADWYRGHGTSESPGTLVCTVSGDTVRHGVAEFEMGTPLGDVLDQIGGGMPPGRSIQYVLSGVSNPVLEAKHLATPLTYEAMASIGSGLGTGGFIVFDDRTDPLELAHAVSTFLYVESCGQCPACKLGTGRITELLDPPSGTISMGERVELRARLATVTDSSRCFLPTQAQRVVTSLLPDIDGTRRRAPRGLTITKLVELVDDRFQLDERQAHKRPDWTYTSP